MVSRRSISDIVRSNNAYAISKNGLDFVNYKMPFFGANR